MVDFIANAILGLMLSIPLGPLTVEVFKRGITGGIKPSLITIAGAVLAEIIYFSLILFGLGFLKNSPFFTLMLGFFGVAFLCYLGYANLKNGLFFTKFEGKLCKGNGFIVGFLVTFLNPVNFFMWAGIIAANFAKNPSIFVASGVLVGIFSWFLFISFLAGFAKKVISDKIFRIFYFVAGLFLVYYGFKMLHDLLRLI